MTENQLSSNMSIQEDVLKLKVENEQLKQQILYLEDNLRVARKDREILRDDVANGLKEFIKERPFTSLRLLVNKEIKEENEQLKQQIEKIGDFIQSGDLCSICKFENKCNPNECYSQNIRVYTKWELEE